VSDEAAAALGRFFFGGIGPSHSIIGNVFVAAGYREDDPYDPTTQTPNKETRVRTVVLEVSTALEPFTTLKRCESRSAHFTGSDGR
jgi:hypothetical protein